MPFTTVLLILNVVNGLLTVVKTLPTVKTEIQSLLAKISPHVNSAGKDAQAAFIAAQQRLVDGGTRLINPANGTVVPE
jgi:hypothetical protein